MGGNIFTFPHRENIDRLEQYIFCFYFDKISEQTQTTRQNRFSGFCNFFLSKKSVYVGT